MSPHRVLQSLSFFTFSLFKRTPDVPSVMEPKFFKATRVSLFSVFSPSLSSKSLPVDLLEEDLLVEPVFYLPMPDTNPELFDYANIAQDDLPVYDDVVSYVSAISLDHLLYLLDWCLCYLMACVMQLHLEGVSQGRGLLGSFL